MQTVNALRKLRIVVRDFHETSWNYGDQADVLFELISIDAQCEDLRIKGCSRDVEASNSAAAEEVWPAERGRVVAESPRDVSSLPREEVRIDVAAAGSSGCGFPDPLTRRTPV